jgi:hypothetical protein
LGSSLSTLPISILISSAIKLLFSSNDLEIRVWKKSSLEFFEVDFPSGEFVKLSEEIMLLD